MHSGGRRSLGDGKGDRQDLTGKARQMREQSGPYCLRRVSVCTPTVKARASSLAPAVPWACHQGRCGFVTTPM